MQNIFKQWQMHRLSSLRSENVLHAEISISRVTSHNE
jgi:hypothetical protein